MARESLAAKRFREDAEAFEKRAADARAAFNAQVELDRKNTIVQPRDGSVVSFTVTWNHIVYTYAAIRLGPVWFTTGQRGGTKYTWDQLVDNADEGSITKYRKA